MARVYEQISSSVPESLLECPLNGPSACAIRKLWKDDYSGLEVETWGDGTAKTYTNAASCALCGKMFADATMDFDVGNEMALQVEALISRTRSFDMSGNEKEWSISNQILERLAGRLGFDPINYGAEAMSYLTRIRKNKSAHGWTKELFESVAMFLALVNKGNTRITMKDVCEKHKYELIRDLPKPPRMDWGDVDHVRANRLLRDLVKNGIVEYKPVRDIETIIRNSEVVRQKFDESMVQRALELAESNKSISRSKNVAAASVYIALKEAKPSSKVTQKQISKDFNVAERSLRHSIKVTKESVLGVTRRNPAKEKSRMPGSLVRLLRDIRTEQRNDELS